MSEFENFEKNDIGSELLMEWYQEKGLSLTEKEKEKIREKEDKDPEPQFVSNISGKTKDDLRKEEEEKKMKVKNKIKILLAIGEKKGLECSIKEAKKENDPFLLDIFHDVLAKDGAYKKFLSR